MPFPPPSTLNMTRIYVASTGPIPAKNCPEEIPHLDYDNLSIRDAAWLNLSQRRLRLVGALWREQLSSVPLLAACEKEEVEKSGDPLEYWTRYAGMCPASMPLSRISESFIPSVHEPILREIEDLLKQEKMLMNPTGKTKAPSFGEYLATPKAELAQR